MGGSLDRMISVEDFRQLARRRLPKSIFEFIDGGAVDELTLADNRAGFDRLRLVPRVLADVAQPDLSVPLWDQTLPVPLVISPMGSCMLAWPMPMWRLPGGHRAGHSLCVVDHVDHEHRAHGALGRGAIVVSALCLSRLRLQSQAASRGAELWLFDAGHHARPPDRGQARAGHPQRHLNPAAPGAGSDP